MTSRLSIGRARLLLLAVAGTVCGHVVSYGVAFPDRAARQSVLRLTGHAYWHAAVAAAVLGGLWFAGSHIARHVAAGRERRVLSSNLLSVMPRLAALQVAVFLGMEISERVAARAPLSTVIDHRVVVIGITVQLFVSALLVLACHALGRAAAFVGRHFAPPRPFVRGRFIRPVPVVIAPRLLSVAPCGSRGPPLS